MVVETVVGADTDVEDDENVLDLTVLTARDFVTLFAFFFGDFGCVLVSPATASASLLSFALREGMLADGGP